MNCKVKNLLLAISTLLFLACVLGALSGPARAGGGTTVRSVSGGSGHGTATPPEKRIFP